VCVEEANVASESRVSYVTWTLAFFLCVRRPGWRNLQRKGETGALTRPEHTKRVTGRRMGLQARHNLALASHDSGQHTGPAPHFYRGQTLDEGQEYVKCLGVASKPKTLFMFAICFCQEPP